MRIAVPCSDDRGLESEVSMHFGRSPYYVFVDVENGEIKDEEVVEVPFKDHAPGDLPNFVKENGGELVIAYGMGHRAIDFFHKLGIDVVTGAYGKVRDVVEGFIKNMLQLDPYWKEKIEKDKGEEH